MPLSQADDRQALRLAIKVAYQMSGGDPVTGQVDIGELKSRTGAEGSEFDAALRYLFDKGLLKSELLGWDGGGSISVTSGGIDEVESLLKTRAEPPPTSPLLLP